MYCYAQCPQPAAGHHWPIPLLDTPGHSQASLGQSLVGSLLSFFLGPGAHKVLFVPSKSLFHQSCVKFWQLYGGVNGDLLQEGLCHTQVCFTQSPYPCSRPLLTDTFSGYTQTQFWLSICGIPGSWCAQDLLEPSERLWWELALILKANLPLLPSCWGFSFVPEYQVSPHSHSSTAQPPLQHLLSCRGFPDIGRGISPQGGFRATQPLLLV